MDFLCSEERWQLVMTLLFRLSFELLLVAYERCNRSSLKCQLSAELGFQGM